MCIPGGESDTEGRVDDHLVSRIVTCADDKGRMGVVILLWERFGS